MQQKQVRFQLKGGSLIIFSNDVFHRLIPGVVMECSERIILSYFLVHLKKQIATTMNVKNEFPVNMVCK